MPLTPPIRRIGRVRLACWLVALAFGLFHVWMYLHDIQDVDGISYLDLGDAYLRGDWATAVNGYWSPLYAWLLGLAMLLLRPVPAWEVPTTQLVNLAIYAATLGCFDLLLRELTRAEPTDVDDAAEPSTGLPAWALLPIGYALFVWSALYWQRFWLQTPDMLVAAVVFVAAALLVRIHRGVVGWRVFATLGVVLGVGYLAKAAMFPLALVFLGLAAVVALAASGRRRAVLRSLLALATFLLVAAPLVVALSATKGRVTIGDTGRLNYAWFVSQLRPVPDWRDWPQWSPGGELGAPVHAPRQLHQSPRVYEFAAPVGGTYPPWYDPSYWHEGLRPPFDARLQLERLNASVRFYYEWFAYGPQPGLFVVVVLLAVAGAARGPRARALLRHWYLVVPALAALGMYALVNVEGRYVAPFVVVAWLGVLAGVRLPASPWGARLAAGAAAAVVSLALGLSAVGSARDALGEPDPDNDARTHVRVAAGLASVGVGPGAPVAFVGSWLSAMRWGRLARVRLVAEVPWKDRETFWKADPGVQSRVVAVLCSTGAELIVADEAPAEHETLGWSGVAGAPGYAYRRCAAGARAP